jgi:IS605 OrfB family transposase
MKLGRRIAMDLTSAQAIYMSRASGVSRFAWNWSLAKWHEQSNLAKAELDPEKKKNLWPSVAKLKTEWSQVRRVEFPWSLEVTKCAGSQAIMDLGATYARAIKENKEAKRERRKVRKMFGFPKFKKKYNSISGFAIWNDQISICQHYSVCGRPYSTVTIPNLGRVKLRELVPSIGGILGARVSFRKNRWFIAFQFDTEWNDGEVSDKAATIRQSKVRKAGGKAPALDNDDMIEITSGRPERLLPLHQAAGAIGGFDLGLIDAVVGYVEPREGNNQTCVIRAPNPRRLTESDKKRRIRIRRERRLSRSILRARMKAAKTTKLAKKDTLPVTQSELNQVKLHLSGRQRRLSKLISKTNWTLSDQRDDFLHKLSARVATSSEIVVLENLHIRGMMANRSLAKSLSDASLGKLGQFIEYKSKLNGGLCLRAPRFFPSSKMCSSCELINRELVISDREWTCIGCGVIHDRDENAGRNLHHLGRLASCWNIEIPQAFMPWAEWIDQSRQDVEKWRAEKAKSNIYTTVGSARPEFTREERFDRATSNRGRGNFVEPRTKQEADMPLPSGRNHICSLIG